MDLCKMRVNYKMSKETNPRGIGDQRRIEDIRLTTQQQWKPLNENNKANEQKNCLHSSGGSND